ncbi:MAG: fasciclin domain-containing protein [Prolixibacteraceae bacterium]
MKTFIALTKFLLISALVLILTNCEDDHFGRYEDPPWLDGSIMETLTERGNYSILIELIKKAGYEEPIVNGLFTVFAANDSAYQAYFDSKGISSVEDLTEEQAFNLFTLNVINTPRARQQLVFDYSYWHGGWQTAGSELGALLFRQDTKSVSSEYYDEVRYYNVFIGETLKILGQAKKVPLLSTEFFKDYNGAPDGSDYTYFFPDTKWTGLQWYNASIKDNAKCSNGYVYFLDKAVPEIPGIEEYLKNNPDKFSVYYDLIQRFAVYNLSGYDDDEAKTKLYNKSYRGISNLANEVGPTSGTGLTDRRDCFTAFIPNDNIFQEYINNTFLKSFESLDSVPEISLIFLAQSCIKNTFDIPSKIQHSFVNSYGDKLPIDVYSDVDDAILLSNAAVYSMNKYYPPKAFSSTISPVFFDNKYTTYLYGIDAAQMVASLTSPDLEVTIFAPTNDGLMEGGIRFYKAGRELQSQKEDGTWSIMTFAEAKAFVSDQVVTDNAIGFQTDFSDEGFLRMSSGNYIYYKNNSIQGGGNQEMDDFTKIIETKKGENGILYTLDKAIIAPKNDPARFISKDPDLSEFYNLLFEAELADTAIDAETNIEYPEINFLKEFKEYSVFAPSNDALNTARSNGLMPSDIDSLKQFIRYHFVVNNVIFNDGKLNGNLSTARIDSSNIEATYYTPIQVVNSKNNLRLVDRSGSNINVNNSTANYLVQFGVVHKIDKVLLGQ